MLSLSMFAGVLLGLLMVVWVLALGVFFQRLCLGAQAAAASRATESSSLVVAPVVAVPHAEGDSAPSSEALAA